MKVRVITGAIIFVALVATLVLRQVLSILVFDIFIFIIMLASAYEAYHCFNAENTHKTALIPIFISFALSIAGYYVLGFEGVFFGFCIGLFLASMLFLFTKESKLETLFSTIFVMLYPVGIMFCAVYINHGLGGLLGIALALTVATFTDTFAYFIGVLFGKHKLCPTISPKKTVEGFFGGIMGGIIAAGLCFLLFEVLELFTFADVYSFGGVGKFWIYIIIGILGAVFDTLGDLFASQIKRKCGIKDFGRIFPGHGGFLDRVDGLIFVLPLIMTVSYFAL